MERVNAINDNEVGRQIAHTHKIWQPHFRHDLTDEGARQILENVTGFFRILAEWRLDEISASANRQSSTLPRVSEQVDQTDGEVRHDG